MSPVEVITSVQEKSHPNQLFRWMRLFHEGVLQAAQSEEPLVPLRGLRMGTDV